MQKGVRRRMNGGQIDIMRNKRLKPTEKSRWAQTLEQNKDESQRSERVKQ